MKFWFDTDPTEWRELVPRQRIGDCSEIHILHARFLCSAVVKSPYFSDRRMDLFWFFPEVTMNTVLPFFMSPLLKRHLPSLSWVLTFLWCEISLDHCFAQTFFSPWNPETTCLAPIGIERAFSSVPVQSSCASATKDNAQSLLSLYASTSRFASSLRSNSDTFLINCLHFVLPEPLACHCQRDRGFFHRGHLASSSTTALFTSSIHISSCVPCGNILYFARTFFS